ncbi:MAG: RNA polymerase sigma factor [Anaeromyxobacteraceae bacterium]
MQAYAEGDADAFQQLFDSLSPALQAFFRHSVQDASVAEDLVQTTFLKLHVARRRWRRGERLRPWVFAIAAHIRVDWYRSRGRTEPDELVDDAAQDPAGDDPSVELGVRERHHRVHTALESLTEPQRIVVHLHRFEGFAFAEVGAILGISEGAAKLRAFRAYAELRKRLGDLGTGDG